MTDLIKDLSELRLNYQKGELHEEQVNPNPHEQFLLWFNHALEAHGKTRAETVHVDSD